MEPKRQWLQFVKTGAVEDYLAYRASVSQRGEGSAANRNEAQENTRKNR